MPHVCLQRLLDGQASEPNPLRYTDFASSEQSIPSFSSPPPTRGHSKPIARKSQNGFLQEAVSKTLRRSAFPPARDSPRRSVPDTALSLNARPSSTMAKAFDKDRCFMLIEVAGDECYFQTITRSGDTVESGLIQ